MENTFDKMILAMGMDPLPPFLAAKTLPSKEIWLAVPADAQRSADCFVNAVGRETVTMRWGAWDGGTNNYQKFADHVVGENITGEKVAIVMSTGTRVATVALSRLADKLSRNNDVSLLYVNMRKRNITVSPQDGNVDYIIDINVHMDIPTLAKLAGTEIRVTSLSTERDIKRANKFFPLALEVNQRKEDFGQPIAIAPRFGGMEKRVAAIATTPGGRVIVIDDDKDPQKSLAVARALNGASGVAVIVNPGGELAKLRNVAGFDIVETLQQAIDIITDFGDVIGKGKNRYANRPTVYPDIFDAYGMWIED